MSEVRRLPLSAIKLDPAVQQRVEGTSQEIVRGYADNMRAGDKFPPVVVFSKDGVTYHLADGFHRIEAYRLANLDAQEIDCELRPGDRDDAVVFACGANASHGLRRSIADKKKAVLRLLTIERCSQWSDRDIARQCNVSHPFVGKVRGHLETLPDEGRDTGEPTTLAPSPFEGSATDAPASAPDRRRKVRRGGVTYDMKTGAIGSRSPRSSQRKSSWSEASMAERIKFVRDVGGRELLDALKHIDPGFSILNWAWQNSEPEKRQSFATEYEEEITALAKPVASAIAAHSPDASANTHHELGPDGDGLDIP
jgi:hypothetical protein